MDHKTALPIQPVASPPEAGTPAMPVAARARRLHTLLFIDPPGYPRHRPEATLLYRLVEQEFAAYLKCGRREEGFPRARCEQCHAEKLVALSCKKRGF